MQNRRELLLNRKVCFGGTNHVLYTIIKFTVDGKRYYRQYDELNDVNKERAWCEHNKYCGKELSVTTVDNFSNYIEEVKNWN